MTEVEKRLGDLAEAINAEHRAFVGTFQKTLEHGIRAGELLAKAKDQCPHGTWLPWLEKNFEGSTRTAQEYMRLYNNRDAVRAKTRDTAHLSMSGALKEIAAPSSGEPFYEALGFIESEERRLATITAPEWGANPSEGLTELYRHEERAVQALQRVGESYLGAAENIRAIYVGYDHGKAAGWLRETLISMCADGPYGHAYRTALREARYRLSDAVADEAFKRRIQEPLNEGTVTVDLRDEETVLLKVIDPSML